MSATNSFSRRTPSPYSLANNSTALHDLASNSSENRHGRPSVGLPSWYNVNNVGESPSSTGHPSYQYPYNRHPYHHTWSQDANYNEYLGASPIESPIQFQYGLENLNQRSPYPRTYSQEMSQIADASSCLACGRSFDSSSSFSSGIPSQVWPSPDTGQTRGTASDQYSNLLPVGDNFSSNVPFNEWPNRSSQILQSVHWDASPSGTFMAEGPVYPAMNNHRESPQTTEHCNLSFRNTSGKTVPQRRYNCIGSGKILGVNNGLEVEPIQFKMEDGSDFCLRDALEGDHAGLLGWDEVPMPGSERGSPISIRIEWPGYDSWSRQIKTRDWRKCPRPISRAKLATEIAKCVQAFMEKKEDYQIAESFAEWRVSSAEDSSFINVEKLALVALHRVSKGSWQPEFRLLS